MIKRTVEFYDFDGSKIKKELYFHMGELDLSEFMLMFPGGLEEYTKKIAKNNDPLGMLKLVKTAVRMAYGVKNQNGSFIKDEDVTKEFVSSPAYDAMVIELMNEPEKLESFLNGVLPKNIANEIENNPNIRKQIAEKTAAFEKSIEG